MCVIVVPKKQVSKGTLELCYKDNPQGIGMMWGNPLQVFKTFDFDSFYKTYQRVKEHNPVIHFRKASPGTEVNLQSIHPQTYTANNEMCGIMHNGTMYEFIDKEQTDTQYVASVLNYLEISPRQAEVLHYMQITNQRNRFVVAGGGVTQIVGKDYFFERDEAWFSNVNWEPKPVKSGNQQVLIGDFVNVVVIAPLDTRYEKAFDEAYYIFNNSKLVAETHIRGYKLIKADTPHYYGIVKSKKSSFPAQVWRMPKDSVSYIKYYFGKEASLKKVTLKNNLQAFMYVLPNKFKNKPAVINYASKIKKQLNEVAN